MSSTKPPSAPIPLRNTLLSALGIAAGALALSLFFFSPRLWVLAQPMPGSTYWERGLQFMQQVESPLQAQLDDPGLIWRLAPAYFAHGLGLHGNAVFVVPWLGLVVMLTLCAHLVLTHTGDRRFAFLFTALVATTNATLVVTGWLGLNDAWYVVALLVLAFQPALASLIVAALLGPWIDERFILAFPLAWYVRAKTLGASGRPVVALVLAALSIGGYTAIRISNPFHLPTAAVDGYLSHLSHSLPAWLPWTSLGWFMGLRAAWVLVAWMIGEEFARGNRRDAFCFTALALAALCAITVLAADTGRAPTMLLPLVLLGADRLFDSRGATAARRTAGLLLIANLLMPAMHVTYKNGDLINMLPIELLRLRH